MISPGVVRVPMQEIRDAHARTGHHWFEPLTMRFFRSRVAQYAYRGPGGTYFVSSERGPSMVRRYSVRVANADGSIDTVGAFQGFESRNGADARALSLAVWGPNT